MINKNKKGLTMPNFLIGTLIFSSIIALFVIMIANISVNYPDNPNIINENISNNYNEITQQLETIGKIRETSLSEEGLSFRGAFDVTFGSFFTVVRLIFSSLALLGGMYVNFMVDFSFIPSAPAAIFFTLGIAIVTILLLFKVINSIGRGQL